MSNQSNVQIATYNSISLGIESERNALLSVETEEHKHDDIDSNISSNDALIPIFYDSIIQFIKSKIIDQQICGEKYELLQSILTNTTIITSKLNEQIMQSISSSLNVYDFDHYEFSDYVESTIQHEAKQYILEDIKNYLSNISIDYNIFCNKLNNKNKNIFKTYFEQNINNAIPNKKVFEKQLNDFVVNRLITTYGKDVKNDHTAVREEEKWNKQHHDQQF
eukprot:449448_1